MIPYHILLRFAFPMLLPVRSNIVNKYQHSQHEITTHTDSVLSQAPSSVDVIVNGR